MKLTDKQLAVALAVCQGISNKQIAHELSISEATVKSHLRTVMRKLQVTNRTQVAIWAMQKMGVT